MKFFNPYRQFVGSFIPNCLMKYSGLSPAAKLLWARLAQYAGEDGYCYPSQRTLAEDLGVGERHIRNMLKQLEDKQFIYCDRPTGKNRLSHKTIRYRFILHPIFNIESISQDMQKCTYGEEQQFRSDEELQFRSIERESIERESEENILSLKQQVSEIISYLNEKAYTSYRATSKKTISLIKALLKEKYTVEDIKIVIDKKCEEWLSNPKMVAYLRPETLFGAKFESYRNGPSNKKEKELIPYTQEWYENLPVR